MARKSLEEHFGRLVCILENNLHHLWVTFFHLIFPILFFVAATAEHYTPFPPIFLNNLISDFHADSLWYCRVILSQILGILMLFYIIFFF